MSGWIKLHRKMTEWEWYSDPNTFRLFIHCLLRANHKEKSWRGININRGQFYTSLDTLSDETGLTQRQIRTCLNKLKSTGELSSSTMARGRMITVVKYDAYQDDVTLSVSQASGSRQAGDRLVTTNKNDKNDKSKLDHSANESTAAKQDLITPAFDFFWGFYPRKIGKKKAKQKCTVLTKGKSEPFIKDLVNKICTDIDSKIKTYQWRPDEEVEYIPHPTTYLNSEVWSDHE